MTKFQRQHANWRRQADTAFQNAYINSAGNYCAMCDETLLTWIVLLALVSKICNMIFKWMQTFFLFNNFIAICSWEWGSHYLKQWWSRSLTHIYVAVATWRYRNPFSQWQHNSQWKLRSHWPEVLRQRHIAVAIQGLGPRWGTTSLYELYCIT